MRVVLQPAELGVDPGAAKNEYEFTAVKMRDGAFTHPTRTISLQSTQDVTGIDPGQDLLIITNAAQYVFVVPSLQLLPILMTIGREHMRLQFKHLIAASMPHPRAAVPEVIIPATRMSIKEIQIVANICSIAYWAPGPENRTNTHEVIDWTTGRCILVSSINDPFQLGFC